MKRIARFGVAVALLLTFGLGSSAWADDKRILDIMLKKGVITQKEYDDILKEAAEEKPVPQPELRFEAEPRKLAPKGDIQKAVESKKEADRQQAAIDQQMVREGQLRGWLGALKDGFLPQDSDYERAPASTMLLHLRRQERIGFHLHNIQMQYFDQPDLAGTSGTTKSQFKINSAELEVSGYLLPGLLYAHVVVDARDTSGKGLGDSIAKNIPPGNNAPQGILRDAFADLVLKEPEAVIRVGQQRIPFGIENQTPGGLLPFINRSYVDFKKTLNNSPDNTRFSNAEYNQERDIGVQARGRLGGDYFDYALGAFNGAGINVNDTNSSKDAIGRLGFNPHPGLRFGASAYRGTQVDILKESGVRNRYGGDFELTHDLIPRLHIMGEAYTGTDMGKPIAFHRLAWYAQAMFEVIPQRTPTSPLLLVKVRYDTILNNLGVADNNFTRTTVGVDYHFLNAVKLSSGYWQQVKFQLEYEIRNHTACGVTAACPAGIPGISAAGNAHNSDAFAQNMIIGQLAVRY